MPKSHPSVTVLSNLVEVEKTYSIFEKFLIFYQTEYLIEKIFYTKRSIMFRQILFVLFLIQLLVLGSRGMLKTVCAKTLQALQMF
jgi:hypothetical protein